MSTSRTCDEFGEVDEGVLLCRKNVRQELLFQKIITSKFMSTV